LWGRKSEAEKLLRELQDRYREEYILPSDFARVHAALGNKDEALTWLEKAHQEREWNMILIRVSPWWDSLRSDPRFDDLVERMNFPEAPVSATTAEPAEATQAPIEKIAVLPFTSISSEAGEEWFVDGMTVTLTTQLGKIKALTVISSRSAMELKGASKPVREIARELGVDGLIAGTVIRVGNNVQITAQLIDGRRDEQIWADIFQGTFDDILALQSEVTLAIAQKIEVALTPEEELRFADTKPINPEAYEAFLKGRLFYEKLTAESLKTAADYFQEAIKIEPTYAEAHAWLSLAQWVPSIWGYSRPMDSFPKARSAANTAMDLDETLAMAHVSVGYIALAYDWDWEKAKVSFDQAIKLNPSYAEGYHGLSFYWLVAGRFDKAMEAIQAAVRLDPLSPLFNNNLANKYLYAGRVDKAIAQRKKILHLNPSYVEALAGLAGDYRELSMYAEAEESISKAMDIAGRTPDLLEELASVYALSDRKDEAETLLQELQKRSKTEYILPRFFARIYAYLDERDEAFRWLEKAYQEHDWAMLALRIPSH
jgi:TolB-like protein/Flp pilus assembly protein TadD